MTAEQARLLRERLRMSQRVLSRLLGLHHMTVWRLENGRRRITPTYAVRLALLAHKLSPLARHPCPACGGTGVVDGHTYGIRQVSSNRAPKKEAET